MRAVSEADYACGEMKNQSVRDGHLTQAHGNAQGPGAVR
jgi:hypothetical protein